jgi:hypothetical protein
VLKACAVPVVLLGFLLWGCSDASFPVAGDDADEPETGKNPSLALQQVELWQGEGGVELWRVKADRALMEEKDGKIFVEKPLVTYFSPSPDAKPLFISSSSGDIDQTNQILRFLQDVRVVQEGAAMQGDLLIYNGTDKTMTMPGGGSFADTGMKGKALFVRWRMTEKRIEAEGEVLVDFLLERTENRTSARGGETGSSGERR